MGVGHAAPSTSPLCPATNGLSPSDLPATAINAAPPEETEARRFKVRRPTGRGCATPTAGTKSRKALNYATLASQGSSTETANGVAGYARPATAATASRGTKAGTRVPEVPKPFSAETSAFATTKARSTGFVGRSGPSATAGVGAASSAQTEPAIGTGGARLASYAAAATTTGMAQPAAPFAPTTSQAR